MISGNCFYRSCLKSLVWISLVTVSSLNVLAADVIPDFYRDPGFYPNRDYINQSQNENIDPFSGALSRHYVDIHLPGNGGFDLKVIRSYNSAIVEPYRVSAHDTLAGMGWTVHFGRALKAKQNTICSNQNALSVVDNPVLELPDGSRQLFAFTNNNSPMALTTQRWRADCLGGGVGLAVSSPDGVRYDMNHIVMVGSQVAPVFAWYTTKITDRNGNFATISYASAGSPEITRVTTSDGRTVIFTYADAGKESRRISQISAEGQTYNYTYTAATGLAGKFLLTQVRRPDNTNWRYEYNLKVEPSPGSYLLRRAIYPQGGSVNYNYGFVYFDTQANPSSYTTVVSSKSLSSGGSWSFTYQPGTHNTYDTTTVSTPAGTITYKHIGPNFTASGTVWMAGLLVEKMMGTTQTEIYTWDKQKISSENYFRPGAFVTKVDAGATNAPILARKEVRRNGAAYVTTFSNFDSYGNPGRVVETGPGGGSRTTSLTYFLNTPKWIINQVKDETYSGSSIVRVFDVNGNLTRVTQDGVSTSYTYDTQGNVTSAVHPRSLTYSYSNYLRGIPQSESQPEGVRITRLVSNAGNVTSETNGEGSTTRYTYDGLNRITAIDYPRGNRVTIAYTANAKTVTRGALIESTAYNGFGMATRVTLGGISSTYTYDALNRQTFASNPGSSAGTRYVYDLLNRVTKVTFADGTSRSFAFGAGTQTVTDERNNKTTYTYRGYGDPDQVFLMRVTAPEPAAGFVLTRNSKDLVTSVVQNGLTRNYGYNSRYDLISVTNPETGSTLYGRDDAGNMTSRRVGSSGETRYTYDGQNRLTAVVYPGSTPSVTNTYNRVHKLVRVNSTAANRSYDYDSNGNLTREVLAVDGHSFETRYDYNSNDQIAAITYPQSRRTVGYAPDVLGRPTQVTGYVTGIDYWPSGQIKQIRYINGTVTQYDQNARLWPSTFKTWKATGGDYINSQYTYDGAGNLTRIADTTDSRYNRTLGYDRVDRLISISGPWGSGSLTYTGDGNITSQVLGGMGLTYRYDTNNRLSSVSGSRSDTFVYDAYGNITRDSVNTFTYDGVPNLRCFNCNSTKNKTEYSYDGANHRVSVTQGGFKTYEKYGANGNLLMEFSPQLGNRLVEYIYLGGKRIAQRQTDTTIQSTSVLNTGADSSLVEQTHLIANNG